MLITSLENDKIKELIKLKQSKYRKKMEMYLVEGEHMVLEAYKSGALVQLILEQDTLFPLNIDTLYVTNDIINKISSLDTPVNVLGLCKTKEEKELGSRILLLDEVQDPGNLGTIIRSAKAFHIDTVVLGNGCVDLYNSKTLRATQGMLFHLNIKKKDLLEFIPLLKEKGIPVYATRVEYGMDVKTLKEKDKETFALILGNEGNGVKEEILDISDKFIYINMHKDVESLNVAIAGSILLYELDNSK